MSEQLTALHEAAHAVVAHVLGFKHKSISIVPDKESLGRYGPDDVVEQVYQLPENWIAFNLAPAFIELDRGEDIEDVLIGAKGDLDSCVSTFNHFFGTNGQRQSDAERSSEIVKALRQAQYVPDGYGSLLFQVFHRAAHKAFNILFEHRVVMHKLQAELLRCKQLTGPELILFFEKNNI